MRSTLSASQTTAVPTIEPATETTAIAEAFEAGQLARNVRLGAGGAVELYDRTVIEDDGPGATPWGTNWDVPKGLVQGPRMARKIIRVDRPRCRRAHVALTVWPEEGETEPLEITFNGDAGRKLNVGEAIYEWEAVEVPPQSLSAGDNEVVLSCKGEKGWGVGIAPRQAILRNDPDRQSAPARSFYSTDGGAAWTEGFGPGEGNDGEFMIRLTVEQHSAAGEMTGPVIDLAAPTAANAAIAPQVKVMSVQLDVDAELPPGASIKLAVRSGAGPVVDEKRWGRWIDADADGRVAGPLKRFVQWRAFLRTDDPTASPSLKSINVRAHVEPQPSEWAGGIELIGHHNEDIRYTSIPFEYEKFDEPALKELREKYKLDEVVAGAKTELEKMIKLRNWVHKQWKYDPPQPPYPAWDAREILRRKQGFCVQFAITYMQCALSLGMQTRFVFGMFPNARLKGEHVCGHEVTEFWSNEHGKWMMMDPQRDEIFLDAQTGIPAGMLELHADQLSVYGPEGPMTFEPLEIDDKRPSPALKGWYGTEPAPREEPPKLDIKWGCVHWMPRNNFYAHRYPEPIGQGRAGGWSWPGYWHWEDDRTPRHIYWPYYTARRSDINWTINQVRWAATATDEPGAVRIIMGTVTPDFETFLTSTDGGEWQPAGETLSWQLHSGRNRIEMRIRNRAGVLGRVSFIELDYAT